MRKQGGPVEVYRPNGGWLTTKTCGGGRHTQAEKRKIGTGSFKPDQRWRRGGKFKSAKKRDRVQVRITDNNQFDWECNRAFKSIERPN